MGEDLTAIVDRVRRESWPPLRNDGAKLRRRANQRRRAEHVAGVLGVLAVAGAAGVGLVLLTSNGEATVVVADPANGEATVERAGADAWRAFGASVRLPDAWSMRELPTADGTKAACIRGSGQLDGCAMRLIVAEEPTTAITTGLDVIGDLSGEQCSSEDARYISAAHSEVNGRPATKYVLRCQAGSEPVTAWALDNRTVALIIDDEQVAQTAAEIFQSLSVPATWPHSEEPSQSASPES